MLFSYGSVPLLSMLVSKDGRFLLCPTSPIQPGHHLHHAILQGRNPCSAVVVANHDGACGRRFLFGDSFMAYIVPSFPSVAKENVGSVRQPRRQHHGVVIFLKTSFRPFGERPMQQSELGGKVKR
jgi:hypothetical protein